MFTQETTEGFTGTEIELLNQAIARLVADGMEEKNASDIVNNNWQPTGNTVESLIRR